MKHIESFIISSISVKTFGPLGSPSITITHVLKQKYAYGCFEKCEISQVFANIYKVVGV
jgi:hypothetical protein